MDLPLDDLLFLDCETTGLNPNLPSTRLRLVCWLDGRTGELGTATDGVDGRLQRLLSARRMVAHNTQFDMAVLSKAGYTVGDYECSYLASLFAWPGREKGYSLKELHRYLFPNLPINDKTEAEEWVKAKNRQKDKERRYTIADAPLDLLLARCQFDVIGCAKVFTAAWVRLQEDKGAWWNYRFERDLLRTVVAMQATGYGISEKRLLALEDSLTHTKSNLVARLKALAPEMNPDSPQQVAETLSVSGIKLPYTAKGNLSVAYNALAAHKKDSELCNVLLQYRRCIKLLGTYVHELKESKVECDGGHRIHCILKTNGAEATGRFSSESPNLQNIPRPDADSNQVLRSLFVPATDHYLVCIDYSQMELRVGAIEANEPTMLAMFDQGGDIHTLTAVELFGDGSKRMRQIAKTMNFLIFYGGGADKLVFSCARMGVNISRADAFDFLQLYKRKFAAIDELYARADNEVQTTGGVRTRYGRFYYVPKHASYKAVNYLIQGTCATVLKLGMRKIKPIIDDVGARMVLCVHDEIVLEVPNRASAGGVWLRQVIEGLEQPPKMPRLPTETSICVENWMAKKELSKFVEERMV